MPGYPGYHWHHYWAAGPASLLRLALPFLFLALLFVLLAAARWGRGRADAFLSRRKFSAGSAPAISRNTGALSPVLASDLERDETARIVSHAVGEGCLSLEEAGQRIDAVLRSRHRHQLAGLVSDLPPIAPTTSARAPTSAAVRLGLLTAAGVVVLAAVLVQAFAGLWELWPLAVATLGTSALLPRR